LDRKQFIIGFIILVIGFIGYRFGVAINIAQNLLVANLVLNYAPTDDLDLLGILLEFGGGIIMLLGVVISVAALSKEKLVVQKPGEQTQKKVEGEAIRCKFCSGEMGDNTFCPNCGRSQK
jgi:hypothetical protein